MAVNVPKEFSLPIQPTPNVLSSFSSYSYTVSLYLVTAQQYNTLIQNEQRSVAGYQLLIQSGGAPSATRPAGRQSNPASRNKHFDVDFYFDDIEIKNMITGTGTGSSHMAHALSFKIIEPYGITFLDRLRRAVDDMAQAGGTTGLSYYTQPYLMVIRFYGYDAAGNLVKNPAGNVSDSAASYEKFMPFIFSAIRFRIVNNMVEYHCEGQPIWQTTAVGSAGGILPTNIEVSGATIGELLTGETPASPNGSAATNSVRGLATAINNYYKSIAPAGATPDMIEIKFAPGFNIETAEVKKIGPVTKSKAAQPTPATADAQLLANRGSMSTSERNTSFQAGSPIVWAINQVVMASTYITDQQTFDVTETGEVVPKPTASGTVQWFLVTGTTELIYDKVRREYAKKTTYLISPYQVYLTTPSMPKTGFRGSHKRYDYWFTGTNKEVINFEQEYNFLYYVQTAPQSTEVYNAASNASARLQEQKIAQVAQAGTSGSPQGALGGNTDPAAAAASLFYSLADQATSRLTIYGDPQWLGEFDYAGISYGALRANGDINFDAQEVLYEINFNVPTDYDHNSGLMKVNQNNFSRTATDAGQPNNSFIYRAYEVTSRFADGKFTQELQGTLRVFTDSASIPTPENTVSGTTRGADLECRAADILESTSKDTMTKDIGAAQVPLSVEMQNDGFLRDGTFSFARQRVVVPDVAGTVVPENNYRTLVNTGLNKTVTISVPGSLNVYKVKTVDEVMQLFDKELITSQQRDKAIIALTGR